MSTRPSSQPPPPPPPPTRPSALVIPESPRRKRWPWVLAVVAALGAGGYGAWAAGLDPREFVGSSQTSKFKTVVVDEGELFLVIAENGTLESANNASIRCQVEAIMGMIGGAAAGAGAGGGGMGGRGGGGGGAGGGAQAAATPPPATAKMKATSAARAGATGKAAVGGSAAGGAAASGGATAGAGGASGGGGGAGGSGGAVAVAGVSIPSKPMIRSFTYMVPPYVARPRAGGATKSAMSADISMMGGGRGGRGGGRGGDQGMMEKPGSTRIIFILPEGKRVKQGDVVCELDSAAFRDERAAQKIRWAQAKSAVDQVRSQLEVAEITQREYRDGIYPQDKLLIKQYLTTCRVENERAVKNLVWSKDTTSKGFRAPAQLHADELAVQQTEIALLEAEGMAHRLDAYTAPRLIKNLQARIEAIRADVLAQESVFQLEDERLRKLERMIAFCTLKAPRDGLVIYANETNGWGRSEAQIQEGVTVREGQTIINLPDPNNMRVRARINESKVSFIEKGMKARIMIDAFPDQPLTGTVDEVTPIPAPANGPMSDVRIYYAMVDIDGGGSENLRPGLSAEVEFLVDDPKKVTRVPIQALRWVNSKPFAAICSTVTGLDAEGRPAWRWQPIVVGRLDPAHAEVVEGLKPGDRVISKVEGLPDPVVKASDSFAKAGPRVDQKPRG